MSRVAVLGLGRMGAPMAQRLVDAGHDVVVWNRSPSKAEGFGSVASDPAQAVAGRELVITMLSDASAVRDVVFSSGMDRALRPDAVYVDMSTIGVDAARRIHESVERATLDAPVGGGVAQAESGQLTVLVGGEASVLDRVRGVLGAFGEVVHCGDAGAGQAMKVTFNAVLAVTMAGVGEALGLAERLGLSADTVLDVLTRSGAGIQVDKKRSRLESRDYPASFALELMGKDLGLVEEAARSAGASTPFAGLAASVFQRACEQGLAEGDYSGIAELFRP